MNFNLLNIQKINHLSTDEFQSLFANVIEHCPEAALFVEKNRPFQCVNELKGVFAQYLENLNQDEKKNILKKHPELKDTMENEELTKDSRNEQRTARFDCMTKEERQDLRRYNSEYMAKFKFPFVICVKENKKETILSALKERVNNSSDTELNCGIEEVKKICFLRIDKIFYDSNSVN
ncbi:2-oxo-4-hydroxy-4-carboxy-5-ureidoimidazoline decarboxylase-like [Prorops nasuta]|uniref:2-oxo-4-hydroxy-4-carboxy-5-ureidoimidazoline decarboxylase-like n=1 Tax=Prorops nasuta TaxID=863751 RepID=UPI0034CD2582